MKNGQTIQTTSIQELHIIWKVITMDFSECSHAVLLNFFMLNMNELRNGNELKIKKLQFVENNFDTTFDWRNMHKWVWQAVGVRKMAWVGQRLTEHIYDDNTGEIHHQPNDSYIGYHRGDQDMV